MAIAFDQSKHLLWSREGEADPGRQPAVLFLNDRDGRWDVFRPNPSMKLSELSSERPLGPIYLGNASYGHRCSFLVWAPRFVETGVCVRAVLPGGSVCVIPLTREEGYFLGEAPVPPETRFVYVTNEGDLIGPDPAGMGYDATCNMSVVLDRRFVSSVRATVSKCLLPTPEKVDLVAQVHLGTSGGLARFGYVCEHFKGLGFQAVQTCPETLFPGRFNAGYDVLSLFAIAPPYGTAEALGSANAYAAMLGLLRLSDRVHSHMHASNLLERFGPYFEGFQNDWGRGPSNMGQHSKAVQRYHREADIRFMSDLGFTGARHDATASVDPVLNRMLTSDASMWANLSGWPVLMVAEDNHNDPRVTAPDTVAAEESEGLGFGCQYVSDKRHSALALALLGRMEPVTQDCLKFCVGLRHDEDPMCIYAEADRVKRGFASAFSIHLRALRRGMATSDENVDRFPRQEPWSVMSVVECHDGPQTNEGGLFLPAYMSDARTATHYLANAIGPEVKLVLQGSEEIWAARERRFGWIADLRGIDKLNAAMGRRLTDFAGDRKVKPPWDPAFYRYKENGALALFDADGTGCPIVWGDWRISWVIQRAAEVASRAGNADVLRPDLLQPKGEVPDIDWEKYFAQTAESGLRLVDFASEAALDEYRFDPNVVTTDQRRAREIFRHAFVTIGRHIRKRDWSTVCVVAWDCHGVALVQRWEEHSDRRLLFVENLGLNTVNLALSAFFVEVNGQRGRVERFRNWIDETEHDYRAVWYLGAATEDIAWKGSGHRSAPDEMKCACTEGQLIKYRFALGPGHAVVYTSG